MRIDAPRAEGACSLQRVQFDSPLSTSSPMLFQPSDPVGLTGMSYLTWESFDFPTLKFDSISTFQAKPFHLTETKVCRRSDYTTLGVFLISPRGFFVFSH